MDVSKDPIKLPKILAIDDDPLMLSSLSVILSKDYSVATAKSAGEGLGVLKGAHFDGIVLDMNLPDLSGIKLLRMLRGVRPEIPVVMLTSDKDPYNVVQALRDGASDYVVKVPGEFESELTFRLFRALENQALVGKATRLEKRILEESRDRYEIVGTSPQVLKLKSEIARLKDQNCHVLILGESGSGKELVARALHFQQNEKAERPFIAVNCAAIPENIAESELFGHEKGAFTGAHQTQVVCFVAILLFKNPQKIELTKYNQLVILIQ